VPINDPSDPALDEGAAPSVNSPSTALVPLSAPAPEGSGLGSPRSPDASFVAQLMACARERRRLQRASPADAETAYRTREMPPEDVGRRTRQTV